MEPRDKLAWGDDEDLETFLRRLDACRLAVGDEKKAVGKALLGLGSRIAVMDALSEADTKDVASLKQALRREFGPSQSWYQDRFNQRRKQASETYGMFLSDLLSLFRGAFPGSEPGTPVAAALLRGRFLDGIASDVAAQLRLMYPKVEVDKLPIHAKEIEEAVHRSPVKVNQLAAGAVDDQAAVHELRAEVADLSRAVFEIRTAVGSTSRPAGASAGGGVTSFGAGRVDQGAARRDRDHTRSSVKVNWESGPHGRAQGQREGGEAAGPDWPIPGRGRSGYRGGQMRCWTCGFPGHRQVECTQAPVGRGRGRPAPVICWRCREFGHTQYDCPHALN